jgi:hypothetical protein
MVKAIVTVVKDVVLKALARLSITGVIKEKQLIEKYNPRTPNKGRIAIFGFDVSGISDIMFPFFKQILLSRLFVSLTSLNGGQFASLT